MDNTSKHDELNDSDKSIIEMNWDNFKLFCLELYELLLDDFNTFLNFLTANKQYVIYSILLIILTQIVSINSLGQSARKYCKGGSNQNGGAGEAVSVMDDPTYLAAQKKIIEKKKALDYKKGKDLKTQEKSEKMLKKSELDKNKERINFFQSMKKKFQPDGWFGRFGALGPVFGNLEAIMNSVKWLFALMIFIAILIGALSLPVIIFMVITYFVIKSLLRKFIIL